MKKNLCDMVRIKCVDCPFGFLDHDTDCPLYYNEDFAIEDLTDIAEKLNRAITLLKKG